MFIETKKQICNTLDILDSENKNFSSLFIGPCGYTLIKTFLDIRNIDVEKIIFSPSTKRFLEVLGFYSGQCEIINDRHKVLPFKTINSQDDIEVDQITNDFTELLQKFGGIDGDLLDLISSMLGELLNNICHHSGTHDYGDDTGEVIIGTNFHSGQFFDKTRFIQFAIVDTGVGILSSVRSKIPEIEDTQDAIKKALEPRFTGGTTLENKNKNFSGIYNGGIGLTATLATIKNLKGDFFLGTKDCLFSYCGSNGKEEFNVIPTWKGTFVVFNIYIDNTTDIKFSEIKSTLLGVDNDDEFVENIDFL